MQNTKTAKMKMRYYALRKIDGRSCRRIFRGWKPVRELIDKGHKLHFVSAASREEAEGAFSISA